MAAALSYLDNKYLQPTDMTEAEYSQLMTAWELERAFVMATVEDARILDANRSVARAVVAGEVDDRTARDRLRRFYDSINYQAPADQQGGIKDLRSVQRMKATIDTNVALARGWKMVQDSKGSIAYPALELYRQRPAAQPRDWTNRWAQAFAEVGGEGAVPSPMIALVTSPIWAALSRFDQPHPPFDYGSKMWVRRVPFTQAMELGLVQKPSSQEGKQEAANIKKETLTSLNADVEISADFADAGIAQQVDSALGGLAQRVGGKIVLNDINGTRPYTSEELGVILTSPNRGSVPTLQLDAVSQWVKNSDLINDPLTESDWLHRGNMARLLERIVPESVGQNYFRGLSFQTKEELDHFLSGIETNGLQPRGKNIAQSFSRNLDVALNYSSMGNFSVVIEAKNTRSMRSLTGLYKTMAAADSGLSIFAPEEELLLPASAALKSTSMREENGIIYITMEEGEDEQP